MNPILNNYQAKEMQTVQLNKVNQQGMQKVANNSANIGFNQVFQDTIDSQEVKFSKHANLRLSSRNIELSNEQIERVNDGVTKAKAKGIRDSLVLVDDVALVVNVRSNTVITAMGNDNAIGNEQIYTNIDGAVIV